MVKRIRKHQAKRQGFSLIEVLIGVFLVAVAVVGLVQLFMLSIMNNARANEIANGVFLAQQEIDYLRTLTLAELTTFPSVGRAESNDQTLDINADGTPDFRRITVLTDENPTFNVEVLVFPSTQITTDRDTLIADPDQYKVRARMATTITR
jgi:prepilin-type N-terminal cleavage/methylation domain-containing protein